MKRNLTITMLSAVSMTALLALSACGGSQDSTTNKPSNESQPTTEAKPVAKSKVEKLISKLKSGDVEIRSNAAAKLGSYWKDYKTVTPALISAITHDSDPAVRAIATGSIANIASKLKDNLLASPEELSSLKHVLVDALKDPASRVKNVAAYELVMVGNIPKDAIPPLIEALKDRDAVGNAAITLDCIGPDAREAVQPLAAALRDPKVSAHMRANVAHALGSILADTKSADPELFNALKNDDFGIRTTAAIALARIGSANEEVVQILIKGLDGNSGNSPIATSERIIQALGKIGPAAKSALPALEEYAERLRSDDDKGKKAVQEAIARIK